jgi:hypothetical protein
LDGDSHRFYLLKAKIKKNGGASGTVYSYQLRPNGVTTNVSMQQFFPFISTTGGSSGVSVALDSTGIGIAGSSYPTAWWNIVAHISAERSVPRMFSIRSDRYTDNGGGTIQLGTGRYSGRWNETSTNMTSLQIYCDRAGGIAVGSEFHLYKFIV